MSHWTQEQQTSFNWTQVTTTAITHASGMAGYGPSTRREPLPPVTLAARQLDGSVHAFTYDIEQRKITWSSHHSLEELDTLIALRNTSQEPVHLVCGCLEALDNFRHTLGANFMAQMTQPATFSSPYISPGTIIYTNKPQSPLGPLGALGGLFGGVLKRWP